MVFVPEGQHDSQARSAWTRPGFTLGTQALRALATISLSLRDKSHSPGSYRREPALATRRRKDKEVVTEDSEMTSSGGALRGANEWA